MKVRGLGLGFGIILATACTEQAEMSDRGGSGGHAGSSALEAAGSDDGGAGSDDGGAGARAEDYCYTGFGDPEDECKKEYFFDRSLDELQGSASALAALVGTWKAPPEIAGEDRLVWVINADGTGTYTEQRVRIGENTFCRGTFRVGSVLLVLDPETCTVSGPSGSETRNAPPSQLWAYRYKPSSDPNTLCIGPPDCGIPTFDPMERE